MGNFEVLLMPQALKFYKTCPEELAKRLNKCFEELENNPFWGPNIKVLRGEKISLFTDPALKGPLIALKSDKV